MVNNNKYMIINIIYMILHMILDNTEIFSHCNNVEYIIYMPYMSTINNNSIKTYSYIILLLIFIQLYYV